MWIKLSSIFIFVFLVSISGKGQMDFRNPAYFHGLNEPASMETGDFDGDGLTDIAFTTITNSTLFVLYKKSDGSYSEIFPFKAGETTESLGYSTKITVGDFNKDGKQDIIAFNGYQSTSKKIFILLSKGRSFLDPIIIETTKELQGLAIDSGDINSDGKLDFLVGFQDASEFYIYLGNNNGTFTRKTIASIENTELLKLIDINNDNRLDIISGNKFTSKLLVSLGDGAGNFTLKSSLQTTQQPLNFEVGDFTEDGINDILVNTVNSPSLDLFIGDGLGNFSKTLINTTNNLNPYFGLAQFDYNADGRLDFVVTGFMNGEVLSVFTNISNNQFTQIDYRNYGSSITSDLRIIDSNIDGKFEIISALSGKSITIRTQDNNNEFNELLSIPFGYTPFNGAVGDLDKDNLPDLICSNSNNSLSIHYNQGEENFKEPFFINTKTPPSSIQLHDFNKDGYPDIIYSSRETEAHSIELILSDHTGKLVTLKSIPNITTYGFAVADFDKDGFLDIFSNFGYHKGDGLGNFVFINISKPYTLDMKPGDFDNDGNLDVFATTFTAESIFFYGNGSGGFTSSTFQLLEGGLFIDLKDLNDDNLLDIITTNQNNNSISIIKNKSNRVWEENKISLALINFPQSVTSGDYNKDGIVDIVIGNTNGASVLVLFGKGQYTYELFKEYDIQGTTGQVISQDFNSDGKIDILSFNYNGKSIALLTNDLVSEPTVPPSLLNFNNRTDGSISYSFAEGNGDGNLIVLSEAGVLAQNPIDNIFYASNEKFGFGAMVGNGYVIKRNKEKNGEILNLKPNTQYYFTAIEFSTNFKNTLINYLVSPVLTGTFRTKNIQSINPITVPNKVVGDPDIDLIVTTTSGLQPTFTVTKGNIQLTNSKIKLNGPGPATIKINQHGNDDFMPAAEVELAFCVLPNVPVIASSSNGLGSYLLSSSSDTNNQWLLNDVDIPGATSKSYSPMKDGVYSVKVIYDGCFSKSLPTANLITGTEEIHESSISLYPNPTSDKLFIEWPGQNPKIDQVIILDSQGKQIIANHLNSEDHVIINLSDLTSGLFTIRLQTKNGTVSKKIIKN